MTINGSFWVVKLLQRLSSGVTKMMSLVIVSYQLFRLIISSLVEEAYSKYKKVKSNKNIWIFLKTPDFHKYRLNHPVSLSLSYDLKRSILFGPGNAKCKLCKSDAKQSGVRYNKQNKHQLLHRIASIWTFTDNCCPSFQLFCF